MTENKQVGKSYEDSMDWENNENQQQNKKTKF